MKRVIWAIRSRVLIGIALAGLAVALLSVPEPQPAKAQNPISMGLVGLGAKLLVSDILNDFEKKAQNLIDRGQQAGHLVVAHAGSELQLMIANLRVMVGDLQKKTFEDLTLQQQKLFLNLNSSLDRVQNIVGEVRPMSELILLDVRQMVNGTMLVTDKEDFYISSIRGTTVACHDYESRVEVTGLGLSFDGNKPHCVVVALLDGKELDPLGSITQVENNRIAVKIPAKQLNAYFKDDQLTTVPFAIRSTITKSGKSKTYQVNVRLILLPKAAGQIEIAETVEIKTWSGTETKTITLSRNTAAEMEIRTQEVPFAANERIVGVRYECNDPRSSDSLSVRKCPVYPIPLTGYLDVEYEKHIHDPDYDIVDGGKKAVVRRRLFAFPLTCYYHIDYQTERVSHSNVNRGRLTLKFDEPFEVNLSSNNKDGNFKITGRLFTGQKILLTSGTAQAADKQNPLRLIGFERIGDHIRATFKLVKLQ
jgi:hypothetical protein